MKRCPYAKSNMTPCVLRDGDICYAMDNNDNPICVGCERTPAQLKRPPPKNWAATVQQARGR